MKIAIAPKTSITLLTLVLLIGATVLESCTTKTRITAHWVNEEYNKSDMKRILLLGITDREAIRRLFENDLAKRLDEIGADAVPSSEVFGATLLDTATFRLNFRPDEYDAVLTSRLVRVDKEVHYEPGYSYASPYPYNRGYYGYYGRSYAQVYSPGYISTSTTIQIETNIYNSKTRELIWTGVSETFSPSDEKDAILSLNYAIVGKLTKLGYFSYGK